MKVLPMWLHVTGLITVACVGGCGSPTPAVPAAPSMLAVAPLSGGGHLTWKDNSENEAQFMIERKVGAGTFAVLATVPFNTVAYHDAPLTKGTSYTYRVMAMGADDKTSDYSNEVPFTAP